MRQRPLSSQANSGKAFERPGTESFWSSFSSCNQLAASLLNIVMTITFGASGAAWAEPAAISAAARQDRNFTRRPLSSCSEIIHRLGNCAEMSRAVLKLARRAWLVEEGMQRRRSRQAWASFLGAGHA